MLVLFVIHEYHNYPFVKTHPFILPSNNFLVCIWALNHMLSESKSLCFKTWALFKDFWSLFKASPSNNLCLFSKILIYLHINYITICCFYLPKFVFTILFTTICCKHTSRFYLYERVLAYKVYIKGIPSPRIHELYIFKIFIWIRRDKNSCITTQSVIYTAIVQILMAQIISKYSIVK